MTPEQVRAEWVRRLRSGQYMQGLGVLRMDRSDGLVAHCCLGVLCEIAVDEGVVIREDRPRNAAIFSGVGDFAHHDGFASALSMPPRSLAGWVGIDINSGFFEELALMNDSGEFTFDAIADKIEAWSP